MSTPKGMKCVPRTVETGDRVLIYSDTAHSILQLRHQVPTEEHIVVQQISWLMTNFDTRGEVKFRA